MPDKTFLSDADQNQINQRYALAKSSARLSQVITRLHAFQRKQMEQINLKKWAEVDTTLQKLLLNSKIALYKAYNELEQDWQGQLE